MLQTARPALAIHGGPPTRATPLAFGAPVIGEAEIDEVVATIRSGWIGMGPRVARFERDFAAYTGAACAIAVSSGTAALHLSLIAAGVRDGDEVITSTLTFPATANAIVHARGRPVLVDVDRRTGNLDPERVAAAVTPRTRAVIPVHLHGRPCEMDAIEKIARRHDLVVIEDAAHAVEARYRGRKVGTLGHFAAFSFYATKNLATAEGGMITTEDEAAAARMRHLRLQGITKDAWSRAEGKGFAVYDTVEAGFKYNMTDIEAALGIHQLARLERSLRRREEIVARYNAAFAGMAELELPPEDVHVRHARHLYAVNLRLETLSCDQVAFLDALQAERIGCSVHFRALHLHSYFQAAFGYRPGDFPVAEEISERTVSLPVTAGLSDRDVDDAIEAVGKVVAYYRR